MFSSFREFLLEQSMTVQQALDILGLSGGEVTPETIKKAYRSASMKAHPDKGGTTEQMQKVNAAYSVLKNANVSAVGTGNVDVYAEAREIALELLGRIDVGAYQSYLSDVFGVGLRADDKSRDTAHMAMRSMEFASEDRETVVSVRMSFAYANFSRKTKALGGAGVGELMPGNMSISYDILHNRKKMKITNRNFDITLSAKVLTDPSVIFPADKIKKKLDVHDAPVQNSGTGAVQAKKMKKRDFITTLDKKFDGGGMVKPDVFQIRKNGVIIQGNRTTMMRQGLWQFSIFPRKLQPSGKFMPSLPETDVTLDFVINMIQDVLESSSPGKMFVDYVNKADEVGKGFWVE